MAGARWQGLVARTLMAGAASASFASSAVHAADFRSVALNATVLYDAPSKAAVPLYLLTPGYPLEVVVTLENWVKVRDHTGALSWVEKHALGERRTVLVTAPSAEVRQRPEEAAPAVFRVLRFTALELLEIGSAGWIRVRHADGTSGFLRASQLWGL